MLPKSTPGRIIGAWRASQADCRVACDLDLLELADAHPIISPADFTGRIF
jgi:hypothetical protein